MIAKIEELLELLKKMPAAFTLNDLMKKDSYSIDPSILLKELERLGKVKYIQVDGVSRNDLNSIWRLI